jgi:hypothetical protein
MMKQMWSLQRNVDGEPAADISAKAPVDLAKCTLKIHDNSCLSSVIMDAKKCHGFGMV